MSDKAARKRPPTSTTRHGNGGGGKAGWGGPAKGPGNGNPRKSFDENTPRPGRGHFSIAGEARVDRESRHMEEMKEILYDAAHDAENETNRLLAAEKLMNRIEGMPIHKVLSAATDPTSMMNLPALQEEEQRLKEQIAELDEAEAD